MSGRLDLSLNEVEGLAKRAARGAGYTWGLAEEAGKAVRWMCVHGLDGVEQLATLLQLSFAHSPAKHRPASSLKGFVWHANAQFCPLSVGAYLSDSAQALKQNKLAIHRVALPSLLLPFVANMALQNKQTFAIECNSMVARTDGINIDVPELFSNAASDVHIRSISSMGEPRAIETRAIAKTEEVAVLQHYAHLTYAPATEESRLLGAGTSLSDND